MNLVIDIGNTRAKVAVFDKNTLLEKKIVLEEAVTVDFFYPIFEKNKIKNIIVAASGNVETVVIDFLSKKNNFLFFNQDIKLPIKNNYATPATLGKDRLAGVIGANFLFPDSANLVIDGGTCTTYNVIDKNGVFLGGNITPGLKMRSEAMHHFTARLPLVAIDDNLGSIIGEDTLTNLQTGVQFGALFEIEGFINHYTQRFGDLNTLLTGGNATFFEKNLKTKTNIIPDLVLIGLNRVLNYNF
jgi:type III pantothenate kinase